MQLSTLLLALASLGAIERVIGSHPSTCYNTPASTLNADGDVVNGQVCNRAGMDPRDVAEIERYRRRFARRSTPLPTQDEIWACWQQTHLVDSDIVAHNATTVTVSSLPECWATNVEAQIANTAN